MNRQLSRHCAAFLVGLSLALPVTPATAQVVINEIDYDQPGIDTEEFIELMNTGLTAVNLDAYTIDLINGSGGTVYSTIDLPSISLAPGDYYVVCTSMTNVDNCDLDVTPDSQLIQNGAPDGMVLRLAGAAIDAVSYEGDTASATEGSGLLLMDDGVSVLQGISRYPDGEDTNSNGADLSIRCATPGAPNTPLSSSCDQAVAVQQTTWQSVKTLFR
jgi:hypothetical protein